MTLSFLFGTVGSPIGTPKKPGGSVGAIEFSRSLGLDALELGWVQAVRVTESTCAAIKSTGEAQGVARVIAVERGDLLVEGVALDALGGVPAALLE